MRTYRASRLARAIDEKRRPRCRVPGCVFRMSTCPVHDIDTESPDYRDLEKEISNNGRTGGGRRG